MQIRAQCGSRPSYQPTTFDYQTTGNASVCQNDEPHSVHLWVPHNKLFTMQLTPSTQHLQVMSHSL